jgi:hypothetical protein
MKYALGALVAIAVVATGLTSSAQDRHSDRFGRNRIERFNASLQPTHEVPAVSSPAEGEFSAKLDPNTDAIEYTMTFSGLQAPIVQSHIHFAQPNVNGAIIVWLCGTAGTPGPAGTQTCPQSGTITGTITPANIGAQASQGIAAGEFDEFVEAMREGLTYANIHTAQSPGGEMRGQVRKR